jgi:hypothetical protein
MIAGVSYNRLLDDNKKMRKLLQEWIRLHNPETHFFIVPASEEIIKNTQYAEDNSEPFTVSREEPDEQLIGNHMNENSLDYYNSIENLRKLAFGACPDDYWKTV